MPETPSVLFVCVKNGGKSQMAAGLMAKLAGDTIRVDSAGTKPGDAVNALSAQSLLEVGVDITTHIPKAITPELVQAADVVVTLGREAKVDEVPGTRFENWDTDEPSERGIDGIERMRLVLDDINTRVQDLARRLLVSSSGPSPTPVVTAQRAPSPTDVTTTRPAHRSSPPPAGSLTN